MPAKEPTHLEVAASARKHLARNIPLEFAGYCDSLREKLAPSMGKHFYVDDRRPPFGFQAMLEICFGEAGSANNEDAAFKSELLEVLVRHDALKATVDASIELRPIHQGLAKLLRMTGQILNELDDEGRDAIVLELEGYDDINELPQSRDAFENAGSLASKVTMARVAISAFHSKCEVMAGHFDYKRSLIQRGRPSTYSFGYAVFALADLFERWDRLDRKATVNETVTSTAEHWTENYRYTGVFLDFMKGFLKVADRDHLHRNSDVAFARSVRKLIACRRKQPDLFKLLHGRAKAQEVLDFMSGLDDLQ